MGRGGARCSTCSRAPCLPSRANRLVHVLSKDAAGARPRTGGSISRLFSVCSGAAKFQRFHGSRAQQGRLRPPATSFSMPASRPGCGPLPRRVSLCKSCTGAAGAAPPNLVASTPPSALEPPGRLRPRSCTPRAPSSSSPRLPRLPTRGGCTEERGTLWLGWRNGRGREYAAEGAPRPEIPPYQGVTWPPIDWGGGGPFILPDSRPCGRVEQTPTRFEPWRCTNYRDT